ncbi:MAG: ribbon-helix-helix domain-containing protein [Caulobacterales bacterium]|nr:ribbon-helix-helix domain-containing protein [Caulobacterales bacterium]
MTTRREERRAPRKWDGRGMDEGSPHLVKRSLAIAGHKTSLALEPEFWTALENAAVDAGKPLARLVAEIDATRPSQAEGRSLASAVRVWLLNRARLG